jgi:alpha-tubulin suppressor-like RCC1 family protein
MRDWRRALLIMAVASAAVCASASGDQSSSPATPAAGQLTAGAHHTCAVLTGAVRCWGFGGDGRLGYANTTSIGDDETPGSVGPLDLGAGRTAVAISAGNAHTCAVLDDGTLRCWGFGGNGRLGYANTANIGDDEAPGATGPVNLGAGRTARAVSSGFANTCAILDDGSIRCWGYANDGRLGYGNTNDIGDDETPGSAGPVDVGAGRTAVAVTTGATHTCALLDNGTVRCWGSGGFGQLGYGNGDVIGDDEKPSAAGPVDLGAGRTATAISAGGSHTCAILDNGTVRCWGTGGNGELGYGNTASVGATQTPAAAGPVDLGAGRTAKAISSGSSHTCAILDNGTVRCWGSGSFGQLGYASPANIGDNETPAAAGPVDLGSGRTAIAISAGDFHTCARLDDASIRCWGYGANGRLGLCSEATIGDDEAPSRTPPVDLTRNGTGCAAPPVDGGGGAPPPAAAAAQPVQPAAIAEEPAPAVPAASPPPVDPLGVQAARAAKLRTCLRAAARKTRRARATARKRCLVRYARVPARVTGLRAKALSRTAIQLTFAAAASDGRHAPAARSYVIKQSRRPIRTEAQFTRATTLCRGTCRFAVTDVGATISLTITDLRPRSTYYYKAAARDNVSHLLGRRSATAKVRTR